MVSLLWFHLRVNFFSGVKISLTTLLMHAGRVPLDSVYWTNVCTSSNDEMMALSGSKGIGHCTSFPEFYGRLCPSLNHFPSLFIDDKQRKRIDGYFHTLRVRLSIIYFPYFH